MTDSSANASKGNKVTIEPQKDGPLKVSGLRGFYNSRGNAIAAKKTVFLCRCGGSKNKPFCDGTHAKIGFTDAKSDERVPDRLERYEGREITVLDNRGLCSHAGHCTSGLPAVWRMETEPWIDPDGADRTAVVATIRKCPSGALSYLEDGEHRTEFHAEAEIQVARDGPYCVRGGVELKDCDFGEGASREHYALCRCGASKNKPFCDGSHWYAGFRDDEALTISKTAGAEDAGEET